MTFGLSDFAFVAARDVCEAAEEMIPALNAMERKLNDGFVMAIEIDRLAKLIIYSPGQIIILIKLLYKMAILMGILVRRVAFDS